MRPRIYLSSAFALFGLSFLIFNFFGLTLMDLVALPSILQESIIEERLDLGELGPKFLVSLSSAIILSLGILLVGIYSLKTAESEERVKKNVLIVTSILVTGGLFLYGFNFSYTFFSISFVAACIYSSLYYKTSMKEFRRWNSFRSGYKVVANSFTIIAVVFAIGVFIQGSVFSGQYAEEFVRLAGIESDFQGDKISGFGDLTDEQKEAFEDSVESENEETEQKIEFILPIYQALAVFIVMLGLKPLMSPIAGLISASIINYTSKRKS